MRGNGRQPTGGVGRWTCEPVLGSDCAYARDARGGRRSGTIVHWLGEIAGAPGNSAGSGGATITKTDVGTAGAESVRQPGSSVPQRPVTDGAP